MKINSIEKATKKLAELKALDEAARKVEKLAMKAAEGHLKGVKLAIRYDDKEKKQAAVDGEELTLPDMYSVFQFIGRRVPAEKPSDLLEIELSEHMLLCTLDVMWRQLDARRQEILEELESL